MAAQHRQHTNWPRLTRAGDHITAWLHTAREAATRADRRLADTVGALLLTTITCCMLAGLVMAVAT